MNAHEKMGLLKRLESKFNPDSYPLFVEINRIMYDENRQFPTYDRDIRVRQSMAQLERCLKKCGGRRPKSLLDVGCGMGYFPMAANLAGIEYSLGIDISANDSWDYYLSRSDNGALEFEVCDLSVDTPTRKFDLVTSWSAFEHFSNPRLMLLKMLGLLNPGGTLFIEFSPLWNSHAGAHLYRRIPTPWYHMLFSGKVLERYYDENGIRHEKRGNGAILGNNFLNGCSAEYFYRLFNEIKLHGIRLVELTPMPETRYAWFYDILRNRLPCPEHEHLTNGFTAVFRRDGVFPGHGGTMLIEPIS